MTETGPVGADIGELQPLRGRRAVVTGSSRGIGRAATLSLLGAGCDVVGTYVSPKSVASQDTIGTFASEAGIGFTSVQADITVPTQREAMLQASVNPEEGQPQGIDYLILSAAGGLELDKPDNWAHQINVEAQLALVELFLPHMNPGGKIIYITSHWANRLGEVRLLPGYRDVAETKKKAEQELLGRMDEMTAGGVSLGILSGNIIRGTGAYTILRRLYGEEKLAALEQKVADGRFPEAVEMGNAVRDMILSPFDSGYTHYVGSTDLEPLEPIPVQTIDRKEIGRRLPMYGKRELLVDEFTNSADGETGTGRFTVRNTDVRGHFTGNFSDIKLFRGVDRAEQAAQVLGLTLLAKYPELAGLGFLQGFGRMRFPGMIFPGEEVEIRARIEREVGNRVVGSCDLLVGEEIVTTVEGITIDIIPNIKLARRLVSGTKAKRKRVT